MLDEHDQPVCVACGASVDDGDRIPVDASGVEVECPVCGEVSGVEQWWPE